MADEAVYLHGLRVENFLRCELVEIAIDGPGLTLITGENAQGKSSVLKAIIAALGGTKVLPDRPVREGAAQADVELDLGDKLVHLRVKPDRTATLTVTAKDGSSVYKSPQRLLDALVGQFAFDPLKLLRMKPGERLTTVRKLVGIDTTTLDAERQRLYEQRTAAGRDLKLLQGQLSGIAVPAEVEPLKPAAMPPERVSMRVLAERLRDATEQRRGNEESRKALAKEERALSDLEALIIDLRSQLRAAEKARDATAVTTVQQRVIVAALVDPDTDAIEAEMSSAEDTNAAVAVAERIEERRQQAHREAIAYRALAETARSEKAKEVKAKSDDYYRLDMKIAEIDGAKVKLLEGAVFPVPGMGFDDEDVTYQGIPFGQCSASEQLRMCLATGAALNPRLRLMLAESGNDLDQTRLREMALWAKEHEMGVILERVAGETPVGVVIAAGKVAMDTREVK